MPDCNLCRDEIFATHPGQSQIDERRIQIRQPLDGSQRRDCIADLFGDVSEFCQHLDAGHSDERLILDHKQPQFPRGLRN